MELSVEIFEAVLRSLEPERQARPLNNKRRAVRVQHAGTVRLNVVDGRDLLSGELDATVSDLSVRGVGLLLSSPMPVGKQFVLHLPRLDQPPVELLCAVIHCVAKDRGLYSVGAEFTCIISERPDQKCRQDRQVSRIKHSILD